MRRPSEEATVLVVGATGRTGGRVVSQLLARGVQVRAIVRSAKRLPKGVAQDSGLTVVEADLLSMSDGELAAHVAGCDAVVSCLGHNITMKGIPGKPRDLVTQATRRLCAAIESGEPSEPVKFVLMSTVSVNNPAGTDSRRGVAEKIALVLIRAAMPPAKDNQTAADSLFSTVGVQNPYVQWAVVRPDTLRDGEVTAYAVHDELVASLFKADNTNMSNVAHFMCELITDAGTWEKWRGQMPVIANT